MRLAYILVCLFFLACIALNGAWADNCPPDCVPDTPEHDKWWCSAKTVKTDCEAKDKVNCEWVDNLCKPKNGS